MSMNYRVVDMSYGMASSAAVRGLGTHLQFLDAVCWAMGRVSCKKPLITNKSSGS